MHCGDTYAARRMIVPLQGETFIAACCNDAGECFLELDELLFTLGRVRLTNEAVSMKANEPFEIIVANFAKVEVELRKGMTLRYGIPQSPTKVYRRDAIAIASRR